MVHSSSPPHAASALALAASARMPACRSNCANEWSGGIGAHGGGGGGGGAATVGGGGGSSSSSSLTSAQLD
eukprot:3820820-Prymnesium_polylepis.1